MSLAPSQPSGRQSRDFIQYPRNRRTNRFPQPQLVLADTRPTALRAEASDRTGQRALHAHSQSGGFRFPAQGSMDFAECELFATRPRELE